MSLNTWRFFRSPCAHELAAHKHMPTTSAASVVFMTPSEETPERLSRGAAEKSNRRESYPREGK